MFLEKFAKFFLLLFLMAMPYVSFSQDIVFTAQSSSMKAGIQDRLQVTFSIKNVTNVEEFTRPDFSGFRVLGGPIQSTEIINGRGSVSVSYILQPLKKGTAFIPGAQAVIKGKNYRSNSLQIEVVDGSLQSKSSAQQRRATPQRGYTPSNDDDPFAQMDQMMRQMMQEQDQMIEEMRRRQQAMMQQYNQQYSNAPAQNLSKEDIAKNLFIKVEVDNTNPYVGQQVNVNYKVCTRLQVERGYISQLPSLNGFWTEDFEIPQNPQARIENINGVPFQTLLIKKSALFPQQSGRLELDPATAECITPYGKLNVSSKPIVINVKPLPTEGQPAQFTGAVGHFSVDARVDKKELTTDDVANLTFVVSGSGNIKLIDNPKIAFPQNLGVYDPQVTDTITSRNPNIVGKKTFTYSFNPQHPGDYTIPPIVFSYFDASTKSYRTLETQAFQIKVTEGKHYKDGGNADNALAKDIKNIDTRPLKTSTRSKPLLTKVIYWAGYGAPVLAFIGLMAFKRKQDDRVNNAGFYKMKKANKVAWKRLSAARNLLKSNEHNAYYEEVSKAIWLYLSDKLAMPISALSKENIATALQQRNVEVSLIQQTTALIAECEMALYSPSGNQQQKVFVLEEAGKIIGEFETILT